MDGYYGSQADLEFGELLCASCAPLCRSWAILDQLAAHWCANSIMWSREWGRMVSAIFWASSLFTARWCSQRRSSRPLALMRSAGSRDSKARMVSRSAGFLASGEGVSRSRAFDSLRSGADRVRGALFSSELISGSSPRSSLARTSRTVDGERPTSWAMLRRDASGRAAMSSAAARRAELVSTGRRRPSLPKRWLDCELSSIELRIDATVLADRPAVVAIERSDQCGCVLMIRSAALRRSAKDNGRPWVTFSWTPTMKASSSEPSTRYASICVNPFSRAATVR